MTHEEITNLAAVISDNITICHKEVLTLEEAAQYTGMKKSYLYKLTSSRMIPHSKPNGKNCFFRRTELEGWLMSNPIATDADLNGQARAYCMMHLTFEKGPG